MTREGRGEGGEVTSMRFLPGGRCMSGFGSSAQERLHVDMEAYVADDDDARMRAGPVESKPLGRCYLTLYLLEPEGDIQATGCLQ